jgi:hypothetical protein
VIVVVTAVVGGLAGAHPTGNRITDVGVTALATGLLVYAAGFSKRWSWLVLSTTATLLASGEVGWCLGGAAFALTLYMIVADSRSKVAGQLVAALATSALLLDGSTKPVRLSAIAGMTACLLVLLSAYATAPRKVRRRARRIAAAVAVLNAIPVVLYALAAASARSAVDEGFTAIQQGVESAQVGDRSATVEALHRARDALRRAQRETESSFAAPALAVPGLGPNAAAVKVAIDRGVKLTDDALAMSLLVDPERLRPRAGQIDIEAIRATQAPLARVVSELEGTRDRLRGTRSAWILAPLSHRLDGVANRIETVLPSAQAALNASVAAPGLLGADRPAHFLVLFVTPVESRGSGFPGNYGQLDVSAGHMTLKRFGRTSELIALPGAPPRSVPGPADFLARYSRFEALPDFYNVTFSPDLPTVATVYRSLYPQAGGDPIDGVIRVDPMGLAALLRYTGPITINSAPIPLTSDNVADYLLRDQYYAYADANSDRIDVLDELGHATFDHLMNIELPSPQQLVHDLAPVVGGQHLSLFVFDPAAARLLHQTGLSGGVPDVVGDQVGVIVNNLSGSKIDLFLERTIDYRAEWDPTTGEIAATTIVTLHNSAPTTDPATVVGNLIASRSPDGQGPPIGTNRSYLSIYSPWFPSSVEIDGVVGAAQVEDELGRKVASLVLDVPSGASRSVTIHYRGRISIGAQYRLDVWRQSLAIPGTAHVAINDRSGRHFEQTFPLDTNSSINFSAG